MEVTQRAIQVFKPHAHELKHNRTYVCCNDFGVWGNSETSLQLDMRPLIPNPRPERDVRRLRAVLSVIFRWSSRSTSRYCDQVIVTCALADRRRLGW